ncbi:hypothetical protein BGLY_4703 [Bacillus glycinifermentans]|nr:hypothetical protein BGLY_4703 [Bacillus glycinifermentans]
MREKKREAGAAGQRRRRYYIDVQKRKMFHFSVKKVTEI